MGSYQITGAPMAAGSGISTNQKPAPLALAAFCPIRNEQVMVVVVVVSGIKPQHTKSQGSPFSSIKIQNLSSNNNQFSSLRLAPEVGEWDSISSTGWCFKSFDIWLFLRSDPCSVLWPESRVKYLGLAGFQGSNEYDVKCYQRSVSSKPSCPFCLGAPAFKPQYPMSVESCTIQACLASPKKAFFWCTWYLNLLEEPAMIT